MDIGSMRQRIILQKHILHTDEIGNHQSHWGEILFMFCLCKSCVWKRKCYGYRNAIGRYIGVYITLV